MTKDSALFRELMRQVFDAFREGLRLQLSEEEYNEKRELFAFHMSDWIDDVAEMHALIESAGSARPADAARIVGSFLYHVIPHATEAGFHLLDEIPNGFADERRLARGRKANPG